MNIVQQLRDLGLFIRATANDYVIGKPGERYSVQQVIDFREFGESNSIPLHMFPPGSLLFIVKNDKGSWVMKQRRFIPGPGPHDFTKAYDTENEALAAALEYFTGEPTLIDGWLVPFHRHPELDKNQTISAIQSAKTVITSEFEAIQDQRKLAVGDEWFRRAYEWHFLEVRHQTNEQLVLYLRRDGQEAFVVE